MFQCIQTPQALDTVGHSTQGCWESGNKNKKKERKKILKAENDIHICAFQKYHTAQTGQLKNAALFIATSVNISPLNILLAFSLKNNNSKH